MEKITVSEENGRNAPPPLRKGQVVYSLDCTPGDVMRVHEDIADVLHILSMSVSPSTPHFQRFLRGALN